MNLRSLSDEKLLQQTHQLVTRERELAVEILHHLREIERRRLYLEKGFSSLWAYMTQALRYSESAAQRRIEALRAMRELPQLEEKIAAGTLSLTNVAKLQSAWRRSGGLQNAKPEEIENVRDLATSFEQNDEVASLTQNKYKNSKADQNNTPATKLELFAALENKTQKEADEILAKHLPQSTVKKDQVKAVNETQTEIRLTVPRELMKKLDKVKSLLSHKHPNASLAQLLEAMADFVIAKKDLSVEKQKSPRITGVKLIVGDNSSLPQRQLQKETPMTQKRLALQPARQAVPMSTRRQVWLKAKGRCEFVSDQNQCCASTHQLEIEHIKPVAFGGTNELANLKLFCRAHNQHMARQATLM